MRSAAHININERKPEKVMEGKARETTENRAFLMTSVTFNYSKQRLMDLGGGFFWLLRDAAGCSTVILEGFVMDLSREGSSMDRLEGPQRKEGRRMDG